MYSTNLILIRHLSMYPKAPRAWQTPTSWSIHSGMVLGSLHYGGFFDLTPPPGVGGRGRSQLPSAAFHLWFPHPIFEFSRGYDVSVDKVKRCSHIGRFYFCSSTFAAPFLQLSNMLFLSFAVSYICSSNICS